MKKFAKRHSKKIIGLLIGILLGSIGVYGATIVLNSVDVKFDNSLADLKDTNNNAVTNVKDAIDALSIKADNMKCASGYTKQNETSNGYSCMKLIICTRVTNSADLHAEKCRNTSTSNYCRADGYAQGATIKYGNAKSLGTALETGDAFDCDVNGDGIINKDGNGNSTERFYYVSDRWKPGTTLDNYDSTYAVLIYYSNTVGGVASTNGSAYQGTNDSYNNTNGPETAASNLPTTSQWNNVALKETTRNIYGMDIDISGASITLKKSGFSYEGKAARLLTIPELLKTNCLTLSGKSSFGTTGALSKCNFLMEGTKYAYSGESTYGPWLETPYCSNTASVYYARATSRGVYYTAAYNTYGARPAIEVRYSNIQY